MSGSTVFGKARLPQPLGIGEPKELPLSTTTSAVLVEIVAGGGGPLPFRSWKGSGKLVIDPAGNAGAGFMADVPNGLGSISIQYPVGAGTFNLNISLFVTTNDFVATTTRFEVYRNGVATGDFIDVNAGVFGPPTLTATFALGFAPGERFDLRVSNPGGAPEIGKSISAGYSADFF